MMSFFQQELIEVKPGEKKWAEWELGSLASGMSVRIPYCVINGAKEGPYLYVQAACHGEEINGLEALRRVLKELDPRDVKGKMVVVPVANVLAFQQGETNTPFDDENMNRVWPGKPGGNISERMAWVIWEGAIQKADYLVDLHTGYSTMATHTVFMEDDEECLELAKAFGAPILLMEEVDEEWEQQGFSGKLRVVATREGIPAICPELGGRGKFEEERIQQGSKGLLNVLRYLDMLPGKVELPEKQLIVRNHLTRVYVDIGGIFVRQVDRGEMVEEGDKLGDIFSLRGFGRLCEVKAPHKGCVVSYTQNPIVNPGSSVGMVGRVLEEDQELL